jgi:hypothetical protein
MVSSVWQEGLEKRLGLDIERLGLGLVLWEKLKVSVSSRSLKIFEGLGLGLVSDDEMNVSVSSRSWG